jgi:hypothetical protein
MGDILLQQPAGGPYTVIVRLRPSLANTTKKRIAPRQLYRESEDATVYTITLAAVEREEVTLQWEHLPAAVQVVGATTYSGFNALKTFFRSTQANFTANSFDLTDADGATGTYRFSDIEISFRESDGSDGRKGQFFGEIHMRRTL